MKTTSVAATGHLKFEKFHEENPNIYARVYREAVELVDMGYRHLSVQMLIESARLYEMKRELKEGEYKISNNHAAYYARLFMAERPDLAGIFSIEYAPNANWWIEKKCPTFRQEYETATGKELPQWYPKCAKCGELVTLLEHCQGSAEEQNRPCVECGHTAYSPQCKCPGNVSV
jgi:ribosomal protein S27AE